MNILDMALKRASISVTRRLNKAIDGMAIRVESVCERNGEVIVTLLVTSLAVTIVVCERNGEVIVTLLVTSLAVTIVYSYVTGQWETTSIFVAWMVSASIDIGGSVLSAAAWRKIKEYMNEHQRRNGTAPQPA